MNPKSGAKIKKGTGTDAAEPTIARRDAFRVALSDALRPLEDPAEIQVVATRVLGEYLNVNRVVYGEVLADGESFVHGPAYLRGVPETLGAHRLSDFGPTLIAELSQGNILVVPDVAADRRLTEAERAAYAPARCAAHVTVPLLKEGRLVALLAVHAAEPRAWAPADVALIEETAERTWAAVARARAEARLRESEHRLQTALVAAQMAYWLWDLETDQITVSGMMDDLFGVPEGEKFDSRSSGFRLMHRDDVEAHRAALEDGQVEGQGWHREYRIVRSRDGQVAWLEERATPTRDPASGKRAIAGIVWGITSRKKAEEALRQSEERYRSLFDAMDEGFALCELIREGRTPVDYWHVELNRAYERQTGLPRERALGRRSGELFGSVDAERVRTYAEVVDSGKAIRFERYSPELERWYDINAFPRLGDRFAILIDDITDRKKVEAALRESEARQAFLVRLGDVLRPLRNAERVQSEACRLLGEHLGLDRALYAEVDEEQGVGVVRPDYFRAGLTSLAGAYTIADFINSVAPFHSGRPFAVADTQKSPILAEKAATYAALDIMAFASVSLVKEGRLVGVLAVTSASTREWTAADLGLLEEVAERTWAAAERARAEMELRESEERFREMAKRAEDANRAKDEFLAILSHELRTPLAPILLWARGMLSGAVGPKDVDRARKAIVQSAESQSRLIEDLIDLARLNSGGLILTPTTSSVEQVVRAAVEVIRPSADAKGVTLDVAIGEDLGAAVLDPGRFQQILWNLLSNAVKFTPASGRVSLRVDKRDAELTLEVSDTGQGIAPEFLPRLFERFRQQGTGHNREHKGLGVGLALSRRLVELHGGTLEAESEGPGKGATFRARIPYVHGEGPELIEGGDRSAADSRLLRGLKVLLVEDDARTREAMQWTLEIAGAKVRPVGSGPEALHVFESGGLDAPDVMVCDIGLPGMDGYELMQRAITLQQTMGTMPIASCAVSAHARDVDRKRAIEVGFDIFVAKPVSPERLLAAVEELAVVSGRES
jgi:PAS domain S-box-containing protein